MKLSMSVTVVWVATVLVMVSHYAYAAVPAPAPLLAAGIPAFAALGGGVAARKLWRKFGRR